MADVTLPAYAEIVQRALLIEPLGGPKDTFYYLQRFPEEIYNKSPDSHLYKFMRAILGEAGVNWVKKNHYQARIMLEEQGMDAFDLDAFFGSPLVFGRIVGELLDDDPYGVIPKAEWELIKAKNARYRNRASDYINGARGGNTPRGMELVAKAGLGHSVEIIEGYKALFDAHTDDPLGLDYYGKTLSTEEMIVLPRREVGVSESQMVSIVGHPNPPTGGNFYFIYNGVKSADYHYKYDPLDITAGPQTVPYNGTADHVRLALESIPYIGAGNVKVTGGPGPLNPWIITFTGKLSNLDVPQLEVVANLTGPAADMTVTTLVGGVEAVDEVVNLSPADQHHLQEAVDRIRAQTTIMTLGTARGLRSRTNWREAYASSEYVETLRFVTGSPTVSWPAITELVPQHWIEPYKEKQGPRIAGDLQYHYTAFHNVASVEASTVSDPSLMTADRALADYAEPLFITNSTQFANGKMVAMVNGIYPQEYKDLPGVPTIKYKDEQYWSSTDWDLNGVTIGQEQDEWLIFSFPFVKCCNYVSFDISRDDVRIDLDYDAYDGVPDVKWVEVTPVQPYSNIMVRNLDSSENTWASVGLTFSDRLSELVWTRALRLRLKRTTSIDGHWGYPIQIRNFRAGRNLS